MSATDRARRAVDGTYEAIVAAGASADLQGHFIENRERAIDSFGRTSGLLERGARVCEIGPAGLGLVLHRELGVQVDAYDIQPWFKPVYDAFGIPWREVDLNRPGASFAGPYDLILLCEVIEHLARWPADVLAELRAALRLGGTLFLTTPNLHRLSNRIRMVAGRRLFADFVPEALFMAHVREYTPEELTFLLRRAGFATVECRYASYPDVKSPGWVQAGYRAATRLWPALSNVVVCLAR